MFKSKSLRFIEHMIIFAVQKDRVLFSVDWKLWHKAEIAITDGVPVNVCTEFNLYSSGKKINRKCGRKLQKDRKFLTVKTKNMFRILVETTVYCLRMLSGSDSQEKSGRIRKTQINFGGTIQ